MRLAKPVVADERANSAERRFDDRQSLGGPAREAEPTGRGVLHAGDQVHLVGGRDASPVGCEQQRRVRQITVGRELQVRARDDVRLELPRERTEDAPPILLAIGRERGEHGMLRREHARLRDAAQHFERTPHRRRRERGAETLRAMRDGRRDREQAEVPRDLWKHHEPRIRLAGFFDGACRRVFDVLAIRVTARDDGRVDFELHGDERDVHFGFGAAASLMRCTASSSRVSGMVTRVGMPPPSSNSETKSQPESNAAAIES